MSPELGRIFKELSWTSRLQLLDQYYPAPNKTVMTMDSLMKPKNFNGFSPSIYEPLPQPPVEALPLPPKEAKLPPLRSPSSMDQAPPQHYRRAGRAVGLSALRMSERPVAGRRQDDPSSTSSPHRDDDTTMKLKLFRLMYETVRDSDLKVKRAELIKSQYANSSAFELGYLLGDISDKYNIMTDIALTLQRLYAEWRPIDHINAYEQIANQAIEISHLIDLAKTVNKRNGNSGSN